MSLIAVLLCFTSCQGPYCITLTRTEAEVPNSASEFLMDPPDPCIDSGSRESRTTEAYPQPRIGWV